MGTPIGEPAKRTYRSIKLWTGPSFGSGPSSVLALAGLVALFGFALSLRMDSASLKVIRGARLQAGSRGLKAFARACAAECRIHGDGVTLVPSIPIRREHEARHFLILGNVGGGNAAPEGMASWCSTPRAT
jgi:hypothetical protein